MNKAKSKPRSIRKVKGAVLIMVLAVMVVLIIMLAGALTIASTAGNRAITKYEESQAYYSARSGLDLVTNILMTDAVHMDKTNANDGNNSKGANPISEAKPSQGLVLQEAIVGTLKTDGSGNPYYDTSKSLTTWDTVTLKPNGEIKDNPSADKKKKSYIKFNVSDMNTTPSGDRIGDGQSGLFSDLGDGNIEVKIQLLELVYDDGASGKKRNDVSTSTGSLVNGDEKTQYIMSCRIKVSCTATYLGNSSTVSVILSPFNNQKSAAEGVVSTGSVNMSTNSNVLGGSVSATGFSWGNNGTTSGNIFVNGNASLNASKTFVLKTGENIAVNGDLTIENTSKLKTVQTASTGATPFVFVNGTLKTQSQSFNFGKPGEGKVNLIVRNVDYTENGAKVDVYGDTFIDGYLRLDDAGGYNSSDPCFDGDLYISDKTGVIAQNVGGLDGTESDSNEYNDVLVANLSGIMPVLGQKTRLGATSGFSLGADGFTMMIDMNDVTNGANYLMSDIANTGGDGFCSGNIYYYYYEKFLIMGGADTVPHEYYGCIELEAIRRLILNLRHVADSGMTDAAYASIPYPNVRLTDAYGNKRTNWVSWYVTNRTNIDKFYNKLKPMNPDYDNNGQLDYNDYAEQKTIERANNVKYIIRLAFDKNGNTPSFVDKVTFKPNAIGGHTFDEIANEPSYLLNISIPYHEVGSTDLKRSYVDDALDPDKKEKALQIPTLLSKYANFFLINDPEQTWYSGSIDDNAFLSMGTGGAMSEITDFTYRDVVDDTLPKQVTKNWYDVLTDIATDMDATKQPNFNDTSNYKKNPASLVTRAWDLLNALYKVDANGNHIDANNDHVDDKNVEFITPSLQAHIESKINFIDDDYSQGVTHLDENTNSGMTYIYLTPSKYNAEKDLNGVYSVDTSSNDCIIVMEPGTYLQNNSKGGIVVSGNGYCYIMMTKSPTPSPWSADYNFNRFGIYSEDFYNTGTDGRFNNNTYKSGINTSAASQSATKIKSPHIRYYIDDGVSIKIEQPQCTIMGYMYGPTASFKANVSCGSKSTIYYDEAKVDNVSIDFIGSALVGDIDVSNDYSFIYVRPEDDADPGTPSITWRPYYYSNKDIVEFTS